MFGVIKNLGDRIKRLNQNKIVEGVIKAPVLQAQIIELNQDQLYEKGVDSKGASTGQYSLATIYGTSNFEGKIAKGQRYDHITLKDTGSFYESMKVVNGSDSFAIVGQMQGDSERQFPDVLGLTKESMMEIMPEIKERVVEDVKNKILQ